MKRQSSQTITYKDLLELGQEIVQDKQRKYDTAKACGARNLNALTKKLEAARALLRTLKKNEPREENNVPTLFGDGKK